MGQHEPMRRQSEGGYKPRDAYVPSAAPFDVRVDASSARWLFDHGETRGAHPDRRPKLLVVGSEAGEGAENVSLHLVADGDKFAEGGEP